MAGELVDLIESLQVFRNSAALVCEMMWSILELILKSDGKCFDSLDGSMLVAVAWWEDGIWPIKLLIEDGMFMDSFNARYYLLKIIIQQ